MEHYAGIDGLRSGVIRTCAVPSGLVTTRREGPGNRRECPPPSSCYLPAWNGPAGIGPAGVLPPGAAVVASPQWKSSGCNRESHSCGRSRNRNWQRRVDLRAFMPSLRGPEDRAPSDVRGRHAAPCSYILWFASGLRCDRGWVHFP
jgi:hypothetical protein